MTTISFTLTEDLTLTKIRIANNLYKRDNMKTIEATGKKLNDAIQNGLAELGVTLDEVDVEILENGGWFKKTKVRLTVIEEETVSILTKEEKKDEPKQDSVEVVEEKAEQAEEKVDNEPKAEEAPIEEKKEEVKPNKERKPKKEKAPFKKPAPPVEKEYPPATEEQIAKAKAYVEGLIKAMGVEGEIVATSEGNVINLDIVTTNAMVIGHRGETLDAIQTLAKRMVEDNDSHVRVVADSQGYRAKREASLIHLAQRTADKCVKKGRKISLEPMDSAQRKIIHSALTNDDRVYTRSEGHEPNRKVIVFPIKKR
ncbi:MAG: KH domain-containing protein [Clostridiales bacterium]|nr:KH domain-containing protein [Clostridiales bacterium]